MTDSTTIPFLQWNRKYIEFHYQERSEATREPRVDDLVVLRTQREPTLGVEDYIPSSLISDTFANSTIDSHI